MSEVIRDAHGTVIQRSRNLQGIHRYAKGRMVRMVDVSRIGEVIKGIQWEGKLSILFHDGSSFETNFGSFSVLCQHVSQWRNLYGAPLSINGSTAGKVDYYNPPNGRIT